MALTRKPRLFDEYGADTVRLYTMFTAPADQTLEWLDDEEFITF